MQEHIVTFYAYTYSKYSVGKHISVETINQLTLKQLTSRMRINVSKQNSQWSSYQYVEQNIANGMYIYTCTQNNLQIVDHVELRQVKYRVSGYRCKRAKINQYAISHPIRYHHLNTNVMDANHGLGIMTILKQYRVARFFYPKYL